MVIAQRPNVSRTISGTIFNVTQAGSTNDLAIGNTGTFRVVDEDFLNPLYEYSSEDVTEISMNIVANHGVNPDYAGPIRFVSLTNFTWHTDPRFRRDRSHVLDKNSLPSNRSEDLRFIDAELGNEREFILTLNIGTFVIRIGDNGAYTVFGVGQGGPVGIGETVKYRDSRGFCITVPVNNGQFEVLRAGDYTISSNGSYTRWTFGNNAFPLDVEYGADACVSN